MRLERRQLESWLGEAMTSGSLPDLFVERRAPDLLELSINGLRAAPTFEELDPGCYSFFVDLNDPERPERSGSLEVGAVAAQIGEMAGSMRRRLAVEWDEPEGDVDQRTAALPSRPDGYDSFIVLDDGTEVPSIGPGGHVFVEARLGTIFGSASVRPFSEARGRSTWGATADVLDELSPFFGAGLECTAELGYYEGSWMERQSVIRPTFVFVIESDPSAQFPQRWVVTLPATVSDQLPSDADRR